jgi:SAM-dependent methyltransferase
MRRLSLSHWMVPPRLARFRRLRARAFTLLDVGCGNHSASVAKRWFPRCRYFGVDREAYNNDAADFALMERFYTADLETSDLAEIPDQFFDVIICAHVIEHLRGGLALLGRLGAKLAPGGQLYLEFPSPRALALPGALNFCHDGSHVRVYSLPEVCNVLLAEGLTIRRAGRRRSWPQLALTPVLAAASRMLQGAVAGGVFWDLVGFADFVWAERVADRG